ncbi:hypothetical protein CBER1_04547 [Cercospora berteroae]|uniref:Uncharacterized protein n=1 Tax=Cercospora berteroae TaxID=357750 RepID=A0A2S6C222_9PEZI|nr:hypothetical protein CBER1_04547 [Cercospora berteroae]
MEASTAAHLIAIPTAFILSGYNVAFSQNGVPNLLNQPLSISTQVFAKVYYSGVKFVTPAAIGGTAAYAYLAYLHKQKPTQRNLYLAGAGFVLGIGAFTALVMKPGIGRLIEISKSSALQAKAEQNGEAARLLQKWVVQNWFRASLGFAGANLAGIVAAAVASICTNAVYGPLLSSYSAVPSVQQYCTSKYPVATVTTTSTAPTVTASTTSIENVPAATVTSTSTSTVVSTAPTVTTTTFAPTVTVTTVATTTTESVSTQTAYTCPATLNRLKARRNTPYYKSLCPGASIYRAQGAQEMLAEESSWERQQMQWSGLYLQDAQICSTCDNYSRINNDQQIFGDHQQIINSQQLEKQPDYNDEQPFNKLYY